MTFQRWFPAACAGLVALAAWLAPAPVTHAAGADGEVLAEDRPATTADGHRFVAPMGWRLSAGSQAVILAAPEGDAHLALVDTGETDADAAVAAAWAAYAPDAAWPLKLANDRPPRDGWEAVRVYDYEVSANLRRYVQASALRSGQRWTVVIYDMSHATGEKRLGQVEQVFDRLLPKGYSRESFAGRSAHRLDAGRVQALRQFVEDARRELDVPGVAIGLVQDGEVVLADGVGVRAAGTPGRVDGDTAFMIASNTKALTTLMLARLVEQGRIDWTTPVVEVMPAFRLGDAATTRQVQVRHLVCACTGLPRQDLEWIFESEDATPRSVMGVLAGMQPTSGFGELFQYSNLMAAAAGYVGGHVLHPGMDIGAAYDAGMQSLVLDPLGMDATTFDYAKAMAGNHAMPHGQDADGRTVMASMAPNRTVYQARPAGAAWSTVNDMLEYVRMELAGGVLPDGRRYIGEGPLLERRRQQVAIGNDAGYGMGLEVDRTWGIPVVHHGGALIGFRSEMFWLPEHGVGAVILTNADAGGALLAPFGRRLLEVLFDGRPEAADGVAAQARVMRERRAAERKRLVLPADPLAAGALAARYESRELGPLAVSREGGVVRFDLGGWDSEMATRRNNDGSLSFVTVAPGMDGFEFVVADTGGGERRLVVRDGQHEYVFTARD